MAVKIFICYAREDELLMSDLKGHLEALWRQGLVEMWYDRNISAGAEWEKEIDKHLNSSKIILLLVSQYFMASEYCYGIEMKKAMERHERGEAMVIPVILRPVYWQGTSFGKLQALPTDALPVTDPQWHNLDRAFFSVAEGIRKVVEELLASNHDNSKVDFEALIYNAKEIDIIFIYGYTWRHTFGDRLVEAAKRHAKFRIVLPDPNDDVTMSGLFLDFSELKLTKEQIRGHILEAKKYFEYLSRVGAEVSIWYLPGITSYSLYRFDHTIIWSAYSHNKGSIPSNGPMLRLDEDGDLYRSVRKEFLRMIDIARPA